jgi:hypothetical protein
MKFEVLSSECVNVTLHYVVDRYQCFGRIFILHLQCIKGSGFLWNISTHLPNDMASHLRRHNIDEWMSFVVSLEMSALKLRPSFLHEAAPFVYMLLKNHLWFSSMFHSHKLDRACKQKQDKQEWCTYKVVHAQLLPLKSIKLRTQAKA